jgi:RHS repeat-associated protein
VYTVNETPAEVFAAINNVRGWWSEDIVGNTDVLGEFVYRAEDAHGCGVRVTELIPAERVVWHVIDNYFNAVACTSSTFCVTGDTTGYSARYTGTWATATDIDSTRSISTVTCTSSTFCVTGDTTGYSAKYTGTWATATDVDSTRSIKQVVCESSTLCVAIGSAGYAAIYTGTWATAADVDGSNALEALSCASITYCVASDADGNVLTYNGTSWGSATDVDATRSVTSISCPTTTFCVTGDGSGYAALYELVLATPVVSQLTWNTNGSMALILSDGTFDYIYGPNATPVEEISLATSVPTFMTYTASDSTWLTTNPAGDETGFYGYDAFGNLAFGTPTSAFGYAGQYTDAATGFSNMRARQYRSGTGSFTSRDPDFAGTDSAYTYANGDPVNQTDPTGNMTHGYCVSASAAGLHLGGFNSLACIAEDGYNDVALVTSTSVSNDTDASLSEDVGDFLSSGLASGGINFSVFNTNANTVFGGIRGSWEYANAGISASEFLGVTGSLLYNEATNGSGAFFGGEAGAGISLPVTLSIGALDLSSYAIKNANWKEEARKLISATDFIAGPASDVGEGGIPGFIESAVFSTGGRLWAPGPIGVQPPKLYAADTASPCGTNPSTYEAV